MDLERFEREVAGQVDWKQQIQGWAINHIENLFDYSLGDILEDMDEILLDADEEEYVKIPDGFSMPLTEQEVNDQIQEAINGMVRPIVQKSEANTT